MKPIECVNGHYYDKDKYSACPFCSGETGIDRSISYEEVDKPNYEVYVGNENIILIGSDKDIFSVKAVN